MLSEALQECVKPGHAVQTTETRADDFCEVNPKPLKALVQRCRCSRENFDTRPLGPTNSFAPSFQELAGMPVNNGYSPGLPVVRPDSMPNAEITNDYDIHQPPRVNAVGAITLSFY